MARSQHDSFLLNELRRGVQHPGGKKSAEVTTEELDLDKLLAPLGVTPNPALKEALLAWKHKK